MSDRMSGSPSRIQNETQRCYESLSQGLPLRPVAQLPQRVSLSSGLDSLSPPGLVALIHLRLVGAEYVPRPRESGLGLAGNACRCLSAACLIMHQTCVVGLHITPVKPDHRIQILTEHRRGAHLDIVYTIGGMGKRSRRRERSPSQTATVKGLQRLTTASIDSMYTQNRPLANKSHHSVESISLTRQLPITNNYKLCN